MGQTPNYREKRNAIAAWLNDRLGHTVNADTEPDRFVPDSYFWKDAADLIKFLAANGITITPKEENE